MKLLNCFWKKLTVKGTESWVSIILWASWCKTVLPTDDSHSCLFVFFVGFLVVGWFWSFSLFLIVVVVLVCCISFNERDEGMPSSFPTLFLTTVLNIFVVHLQVWVTYQISLLSWRNQYLLGSLEIHANKEIVKPKENKTKTRQHK